MNRLPKVVLDLLVVGQVESRLEVVFDSRLGPRFVLHRWWIYILLSHTLFQIAWRVS